MNSLNSLLTPETEAKVKEIGEAEILVGIPCLFCP